MEIRRYCVYMFTGGVISLVRFVRRCASYVFRRNGRHESIVWHGITVNFFRVSVFLRGSPHEAFAQSSHFWSDRNSSVFCTFSVASWNINIYVYIYMHTFDSAHTTARRPSATYFTRESTYSSAITLDICHSAGRRVESLCAVGKGQQEKKKKKKTRRRKRKASIRKNDHPRESARMNKINFRFNPRTVRARLKNSVHNEEQ